MNGIHKNMRIDEIESFENKENISVNVFELNEKDCVVPLRLSERRHMDEHVDLLYLEDGVKTHYTLITNIEKLLQHCSPTLSSFTVLPVELAVKHACINVRNHDDRSLMWCILAEKYGKRLDNPERVSAYYSFAHELKHYKSTINIDKLEKEQQISINIYVVNDKNEIVPIRTTRRDVTSTSKHVDLLRLMNYRNQHHYVLITSLSRLVRKQVTAHKGKHYICRRCLHFCTTEEILKKHTERCIKHNAQRISLPEDTEYGPPTIKFTGYEKQLPLPYHFVADFESVLEKYDTVPPDRSNHKPSTTRTHKHVACGAAYQLFSTDPEFYEPPVILRGENVAEKFLDKILADARLIRMSLQNLMPQPILNDEEQMRHDLAEICHICEKSLYPNDDWMDDGDSKHLIDKVEDHDHITGLYRGAAHNACNLNYRINPDYIQIVCFLHNLKNYDEHLILSAVKPHHGEVRCIPNNTEKYISFSIGDVTFKDSFAFMGESLDNLVKNLNVDQLKNTVYHFSLHDDHRNHSEKVELLSRKGVYPYEYIDSFKRFDETVLPAKELFYSSLKDSNISDDEYERARRIWNLFEIQNLGEYHDLYLLTDVLLLSDVLEAFRDMCLKYYKIDPWHCYTAPGLTLQAGLRYTDVELELITDPEIYLLIEDVSFYMLTYISPIILQKYIQNSKLNYVSPGTP